ncbi:hypothetical protein ACLB2K_035725 [Fragaria x ananassa]
MAFKSSMLVFLVAISLCSTCSGASAGVGATYKVGSSVGWDIGVDYHQWSSSKEFHVAKIIVCTTGTAAPLISAVRFDAWIKL